MKSFVHLLCRTLILDGTCKLQLCYFKYQLCEFSHKAVYFEIYKGYTLLVGERCTGSIGRGMCVLIGISVKDSDKEIEWM